MGAIGGIWTLNNEPGQWLTSIISMSKRVQRHGPDLQTVWLITGDGVVEASSVASEYDQLERRINDGRSQQGAMFCNQNFYGQKDGVLTTARYRGLIVAIDGELYQEDALASVVGGEQGTDSSALLIAKGYKRFGNSLWEKLHGQFVVFVYDEEEDKLTLTRDRAGVKSLFYAVQDHKLIFGSNIRTILASGQYNKDIDWNGIWQALSFPAPPQPVTTFKDVKALSRGHIITIDRDGDLKISSYWSLPVGIQDRSLSLTESARLIDESMKRSIQRRVVGKEHTGSLISGGVDSPYLSALLSQHDPNIPVLTFAMRNERFSSINEHELAAKTAEKWGLDHRITFYSFKDIWPHFEEVLDVYEQPGINLDPYYFTAKMAQENAVHHLFNGLCADELHGGFHYFKFIPLWRLVKLFPWITNVFPRGVTKRYDDFKNLAIPKRIDEYYTHGFSTFQEFEKKRLLPELVGFNSFEQIRKNYLPQGVEFKDDVEGLLYLMYANVPNHHLYRFEQFTQHFGVQAIYPFVDNEAVDIAFNIPSRYKVRNGVRKVALKAAAKPYIYEGSLKMKKKGITMPYGYWINSELKEYCTGKLESLKARPYFNPSFIDYIDRTYRSVAPGKVWKLVMIENWMEHFIDN